jgi:hypothetical protein
MQFSVSGVSQVIVILQTVYGNGVYFLPAFLVISLWLLNSQRQAFMRKLDQFIDELEGRKNPGEDKTRSEMTDKMDTDDAEMEMIRGEERKRGKFKLG